MREIPLTQGLTAFVDDDDFKVISKYHWYASKGRDKKLIYAHTRISNIKVCMHWLVVGMPLKGFVTDHKNSCGLDNTKSNLRIIYQYQNHQNRSPNKKYSSSFPGVHKCSKNRWRALIRLGGKNIDLGMFESEFEAFSKYRYNLLSAGRELLPELESLYLSLGGK